MLLACGCTTESKPRLLPFAQSRYEIMVGDSFDITVALTTPATEPAVVDVTSTSQVCRSDPSEVRFEAGERVKVTRITGIDSSRGLYRPVTFALRGTDTSNSLLVLVLRRVPGVDGGGDSSVDGPGGDGQADGALDALPDGAGDAGDGSAGDGSDGAVEAGADGGAADTGTSSG